MAGNDDFKIEVKDKGKAWSIYMWDSGSNPEKWNELDCRKVGCTAYPEIMFDSFTETLKKCDWNC